MKFMMIFTRKEKHFDMGNDRSFAQFKITKRYKRSGHSLYGLNLKKIKKKTQQLKGVVFKLFELITCTNETPSFNLKGLHNY